MVDGWGYKMVYTIHVTFTYVTHTTEVHHPLPISGTVCRFIYSAPKQRIFSCFWGSHWFPQIAYFVNCWLNYTPKHNLLFIKRKVNIAISMQNYIHNVSAYRQFYVWLSSYGQFRIADKEDHPSEFLSLFSKQTFFFNIRGYLDMRTPDNLNFCTLLKWRVPTDRTSHGYFIKRGSLFFSCLGV